MREPHHVDSPVAPRPLAPSPAIPGRHALREQEARRFLPQISPYGIIVMHDANSSMKIVREAALKMEQEGLLSVLLLPPPRGLVLAQKRQGRA